MSKCLHDKDRGGVTCGTPGGNCANCGWHPSVAQSRHEKINHGKGLKKVDGLLRFCLPRTKRDTQKATTVDRKKLAKMLRAGKSTSQIAKTLGCAEGTVRRYSKEGAK